ncbi:Hypp5781 [Branchiostoma lanceolatum]|uniref:Hypp5781 protein n=1 Tax=Branchiostoma lanceolatum TaxID=7740 RepID=A0A8J9VRL0_BRALA|nr:Hypp5781 [Branchiostoma lanceolatum]
MTPDYSRHSHQGCGDGAINLTVITAAAAGRRLGHPVESAITCQGSTERLRLDERRAVTMLGWSSREDELNS